LPKSIAFLFVIFCFSSISVAQTIHTVEDPEITFSLEIPNDWRVEDYSYTFVIAPPTADYQVVEFTYYETSETDLENAFEFTVLAFNDTIELDTTILERGDDIVNGVPAKWALTSFEIDGQLLYRLIYLLIKDGQYYIFRGVSNPVNYDYYQPIYQSVFRSLKTVPTQNK
jgi:chromosome condensin MukBEF complex kleisin-like MukF subunit